MIDRIKAGSFRDFVAELTSSYVILGDQQFYRGYCVLFAKLHATELYLMPADTARLLSDEMRLVAEAIAAVVKPWKMNYECLGNSEPHVHWHLLPRQETKPTNCGADQSGSAPNPNERYRLTKMTAARLSHPSAPSLPSASPMRASRPPSNHRAASRSHCSPSLFQDASPPRSPTRPVPPRSST